MGDQDREDKQEKSLADYYPAGTTDGGVGHLLYAGSPNCPKCGAPPSQHIVRNHNLAWHDGDVYCGKCNAFVRYYDAG